MRCKCRRSHAPGCSRPQSSSKPARLNAKLMGFNRLSPYESESAGCYAIGSAEVIGTSAAEAIGTSAAEAIGGDGGGGRGDRRPGERIRAYDIRKSLIECQSRRSVEGGLARPGVQYLPLAENPCFFKTTEVNKGLRFFSLPGGDLESRCNNSGVKFLFFVLAI